MAEHNSLIVGYDHGTFVEIVPGQKIGFDLGVRPNYLLYSNAALGTAYGIPAGVPNATTVAIREATNLGIVRIFDPTLFPSILAYEGGVTLASQNVSLAVDDAGFTYFVDLVGDISRGKPNQATQKVVQPAVGDPFYPLQVSAIRINSSGHLYVMQTRHTELSTIEVKIERYNAGDGHHIGSAINGSVADDLYNILDFDVSNADEIFLLINDYSAKNNGLRILYTNNVGNTIGYINLEKSVLGYPKCIRVSPDGNYFYILSNDHIYQVDLSGKTLKSIKLAESGSTYFSFFKERVDDFKSIGFTVASVVDIWNGIRGDNGGTYVPSHGAPQPQGPWTGQIQRVWNELPKADRELMTTFALLSITQLLDDKQVAAELQSVIRSSVSADVGRQLS